MPRESSATRNIVESAASAPSGWAARILEKQGWSEGKGLGRREDGVVGHVKVVKKEDTAALGYREVALRATSGGDQWWLGDDPFAKARVGGAAADAKGKKRARSGGGDGGGGGGTSGGGAASAGGDVQAFYKKLFEATGGARLGMRARREQPGKWERAEAALAGAEGAAPEECAEGAAAEKAARKAERKAARRAAREAAAGPAAAAEAAAAEDAAAEAAAAEKAAKRARKEAKREKRERARRD
jgi:Pin2-interacting protein X1